MPSGEYTEQDRHNEGCCWDYVRQLCPGGGCLCNCHATNEEILLSDRATLRRQVVTLTAQLAAALARAEAMEAVLLETCQTVPGDRDHPCWCQAGLLNHLDDCMRMRAAMVEMRELSAAERNRPWAGALKHAHERAAKAEVERDALRARAERAESVIRKALNDLDHGSLWDARAALAAAAPGEEEE